MCKTEINIVSNRLIINSAERLQIINTEDLIRVCASGRHTYFYSTRIKPVATDIPIINADKLLGNPSFIKISDNCIINVNMISGINTKKESEIVMRDKSRYIISESQKNLICEILNL